MKITFTADAFVQLATAEGVKEYRGVAGETLSVPEDIAAHFIGLGQAEPAKAERAVKAKGETATK